MVSESNGNFSTWNVFAKDGTPMTIRHIRRRDISQIWENFNQVVSENRYLPVYTPVIDEWEKKTWYEEITRGKNFCVVAEHQGLKKTQNIIGQCTIEDLQWEAASFVGQLGIIVRKGFRNIGVGYQLIEYAKDLAKKKGRKKIVLTTFDTNKMAISLYKRCGFEVCGKYRKQFYLDDKYIDEVFMECFLENY